LVKRICRKKNSKKVLQFSEARQNPPKSRTVRTVRKGERGKEPAVEREGAGGREGRSRRSRGEEPAVEREGGRSREGRRKEPRGKEEGAEREGGKEGGAGRSRGKEEGAERVTESEFGKRHFNFTKENLKTKEKRNVNSLKFVSFFVLFFFCF